MSCKRCDRSAAGATWDRPSRKGVGVSRARLYPKNVEA